MLLGIKCAQEGDHIPSLERHGQSLFVYYYYSCLLFLCFMSCEVESFSSELHFYF